MNTIKKSIISITLITILLTCFIPVINQDNLSYAETWQNPQTREQTVACFMAYCKSRNVSITDSVFAQSGLLSMPVNATYAFLNMLSTSCGIDMTTLQANLYYKYDNGVLKFMYKQSGMAYLNRIFSALCDKYGIDEDNSGAINNTLYSGTVLVDTQFNTVLVYILKDDAPISNNIYRSSNYNDLIEYEGTTYLCTGQLLEESIVNVNNTTVPFTFYVGTNSTNTEWETSFKRVVSTNNNYIYWTYSSDRNAVRMSGTRSSETYNGKMIIWKKESWDYWKIGSLVKISTTSGNEYCIYQGPTILNPPYGGKVNLGMNSSGINAPITINNNKLVITPQNTTNNNTYNSSSSFMEDCYNNNTKITYVIENPQPPTDPYGDNPTGGNVNPSDGDVNWSMPDLNIDWDLDFDLSELFPFSIPYDIINFIELFESEPVAPYIDATFEVADIEIPIEIDLSPFDDVASYFRTFITFSYVIGLIIATRQFFHIY